MGGQKERLAHCHFEKHTLMKQFYILLLLAIPLSVFAQDQQEPTSFSLKEAIDYALQENFNVKNANLQSELAAARKGEVRGALLPQVSGLATYNHNFQVQKNILENRPGSISYNPAIPVGTASSIQLGLPNQFVGALNASQVLFDQGVFASQNAAKVSDDISEKNITRSKIDVTVNVTKAYYGVLVNEKQLLAIDKNLQRVDSLYSETDARYQSGLARDVDRSRLQVSLNNIKVEKERVTRNVELSRSILRYQLNLSEANPLQLKDSLYEGQLIAIEEAAKQDFNAVHENRIEYSIIKSQELLNLYDLRNTAAGRYPRLMAVGTIGYNPAATNLSDIGQSARWQQYSFVGLNLQVPIFSGFALNYKIKQKKIQQKITENSKLSLEKEINLEVEQALINLHNSMQAFRLQKENIALAEQNLEVLRAEYQAGIALNIEVVTAEASLIDAQTNFYSAVYNALVAKADYDKAVGNILK
ncbi:MAG: TolC family protein [Chitinophagaceae bacterium]|nr:TolC family protein [Chitinophagaceae bacterium]